MTPQDEPHDGFTHKHFGVAAAAAFTLLLLVALYRSHFG